VFDCAEGFQQKASSGGFGSFGSSVLGDSGDNNASSFGFGMGSGNSGVFSFKTDYCSGCEPYAS